MSGKKLLQHALHVQKHVQVVQVVQDRLKKDMHMLISQTLKELQMGITKPEIQPCRFRMFVRVKENSTFRFKNFNDPLVGWYRGDRYEKANVHKMLSYLLGIIKNHRQQYAVMELYDETKPKTDPSRVILKMNGGMVQINRIPDYSDMLSGVALPEWLSYEITP